MKHDDTALMEAILRDVPPGALVLERHPTVPGQTSPPAAEVLPWQISGRGKLTEYRLFPGAVAVLHTFLARQATLRLPTAPLWSIHHCHLGRADWNAADGPSVCSDAGGVLLQRFLPGGRLTASFPQGFYMGFSLLLEPEALSGAGADTLREAGFDPRCLGGRFPAPGRPAAPLSGVGLEGIFAPLYHLPEALQAPYFKLKAQELLLYLSQPGCARPRSEPSCCSRQAELIREIHDLLTQDLTRRYTIEELSRQYLVNTSSLKAEFKAVYGLPIAAYMKEYRIRRAMELLRETDQSIAGIAARVGYESQGKFSKAFQDVTGQLPSEYRKQSAHASPD